MLHAARHLMGDAKVLQILCAASGVVSTSGALSGVVPTGGTFSGVSAALTAAFRLRVSFAFFAASLRFRAAALAFFWAAAFTPASRCFVAAALAFRVAAAFTADSLRFFAATFAFLVAAALLAAAVPFRLAAAFFAAALRSVAFFMTRSITEGKAENMTVACGRDSLPPFETRQFGRRIHSETASNRSESGAAIVNM